MPQAADTAATCHYTHAGAPHAHPIAAGARRLELRFTVDWGDDDIRATHDKVLVFCSFGCLSNWAAERSDVHDQHVLTEGA